MLAAEPASFGLIYVDGQAAKRLGKIQLRVTRTGKDEQAWDVPLGRF